MDVCGCTAEVIGQVANGPKEAGRDFLKMARLNILEEEKHIREGLFLFLKADACSYIYCRNFCGRRRWIMEEIVKDFGSARSTSNPRWSH